MSILLARARRLMAPVAVCLSVPVVVLGTVLLVAHEESGRVLQDDCGLDARAMQARFETARAAVRGRTLEVAEWRAATVVAGEVNVGLAPGASARAVADKVGAELARDLPRLGLATLRVGRDRFEQVLHDLVKTEGVRFAEPNFVACTASLPNDPFLPLQKGLLHANVPNAWATTTGDPSVIVAVLDTGADLAHKDLVSRLVPGYDFVNGTTTPQDDNGHGTTVAGIIAAEGNDNEGIAGVAYTARVMPLKVADGDGNASVANVVAAIDYAIANGARIANVSLGTRVPAQALKDACDRAAQAGVLVVAAAGNDPIHVAYYPAVYPNVLSVTSVSSAGELPFSGVISPLVQVGAPGEDVISTYPGNLYGFVSGSSAAAAFTSGVAALCFSRNGTLTAAQVAQCLRAGQVPIAALAPFGGTFQLGSLDAGLAVGRADPAATDAAITEVRCYPAKPLPGQPLLIVVQVANQGNQPFSGLGVHASLAGTSLPAQTASAALGERVELSFAGVAPAQGVYAVTASVDAPAGDVNLANNTVTVPLSVDTTTVADLRVVERTISDPDVVAGTITFGMTVENRGTQDASNVELELKVGAVAGVATSVASQVVPTLAVGARTTLSGTWTVPVPAPIGIRRLQAIVAPLPGETSIYDNTAVLDFLVGTSGSLHGLYQQSNGVDVIPDAPWRLAPGRDYLPLQVFVPSKGSTSSSTKLRFDHAIVTVKDDPASSNGTLVYEQRFGSAPTTVAQGLAIVDEMGQPRTGAHALELFGSQELDANGHHDIFHMPRSAYGVPAQPAAPVVKYTDMKVEWTYEESLFFGLLSVTRTGSHRAVTKTTFAVAGLPALPGDNHDYDVHHHTIAEWFFGSQLNVFAPRKAYGGPIEMILESAYAMGVTPTLGDVNGKIICTDHNCFYNTTISGAQDPDHRPPFGPTSPGAQPGTDEKTAYETVFGIASGEEIAFKENIPVAKFSSSIPNWLSGLLPGIPIGAHMLTMRAEHCEGPWHGGGYLQGPGNPNIDVNLFPLFQHLAKDDQQKQGGAFSYAAHPFSGQGWDDAHVNGGFGLDPALRTRDGVHDATNKFVLKGLEFWNGRGTRSLDSSKIDFNDLNPWADAQFAAGSSGWDLDVQGGLATWHQYMATDLDYTFTTDPDTHFIRKVYVAGGSDAHGDFNFDVSRLATPVGIQSTYTCGDAAWYGVRTYVFGDGKQGASNVERYMHAYEDGNSIMTDGPLLVFSVDADTHWDSANLRWHAQSSFENADGRIGGEGALDGGGTMLVRRGSSDLAYRYRYTNTPDFGSSAGQVVAIKIYKTELNNPNPTRTRQGTPQLVGRNSLALGGADKDLVQPLGTEGPFSAPGCIALGAFTGVDPDVADLSPDEYRCYTNPVFASTYDVQASVGTIDTASKSIPPGQLTVTFAFDHSMTPSLLGAEVKVADANGATTDRSVARVAALGPSAGGTGWTDRANLKSSLLSLSNAQAVPLLGDEFPKGSGKLTLVLYLRDPIQDAGGNTLHTIATTVQAPRLGAAPGSGSAAPGSTAGPVAGGFGGGGGGGGCALARGGAPTSSLVLLSVLVLAVVLRRRIG